MATANRPVGRGIAEFWRVDISRPETSRNGGDGFRRGDRAGL
ncbi:hypothetical protein [Frankia sp. Cppng1_Ct_nod]|nr:hypothetical protein [Frankia sp. Cppng1_Ct_nod]